MITRSIPSPSPSLHDGADGWADAHELARFDHDIEISCVHVRATGTPANRSLLRRAGHPRTNRNAYYPVEVIRDSKDRLQIAPAYHIAQP